MIKKFYNYLWKTRFAHYAIVGFSSVVIDLISLFILKQFLGVKPVLAVAINQVFIIIFVFCLNKFWSFQSHHDTPSQVIRFSILLAYNYFFAVIWMWFWISIMGLHVYYLQFDIGYLLARVVSIIIAVSWNFFLYKFWVYRLPKNIDSNNLA